MKISRIFAHRVELPLHETTYKWSGGKSVTVFDGTFVGVETDTGLIGYGEVCPLGRSICLRMGRAGGTLWRTASARRLMRSRSIAKFLRAR